MELKNYILGKWESPRGEKLPQYDAITGELIGYCGHEGVDFEAVLDYGRRVGGSALRQMTFRERGLMLKKLALYLHGIRKKYYPLSYRTGATKTDSWIDIDGGIGTLFAYASLRRQLPDKPFYVEGDTIGLSKGGSFIGHHILLPRQGIAVHINAFNFPIWGMLEKLAPTLLAGMPALVKPSELSSFLAEAMVKDIVESGILPEGSLQLVQGNGIGILDHLTAQDAVAFTGSAETGRLLKTHPRIVQESVPFNMEADSLNAAILGPDATPDTPEFDLFIREVRREMTVKCGQKCTAIRRVIVPREQVQNVIEALRQSLAKVTLGDPQREEVRMGALVAKVQQEDVRAKVAELQKASQIVIGEEEVRPIGADAAKGCFFPPTVLLNEDPLHQLETHSVEAFGPVSTVMPYTDIEEAATIANLGKGSLVSTIATLDADIARRYVMAAAPWHGRILILNRDSAPESTGHGSPMPLLSHGGPGRAGGGQELGGLRGLYHYLQRTAIQGHPGMITEITDVFQPGSPYKETEIHPFRKYFEDLQVGETIFTAKHTVTEADITNFANVSGDHFYAHMDATSLDGTIFEQRVAHGYFILSKAAGLFVEPRKGPVLLNYGIDECRFTKPVYPGMTIGVKFTVKEKIAQEKREDEDFRKGIVKFLVDVYDETGETVALATILTMVKMKNL
ncbi:MAG TPA: phenylacetic acid degradation bifunctional protein PaaZ [Phaeodactylibacter sp.]|nr:phenylacetic acid degradation bifunctional protein PaaZ [Phaeodactylibacter sp.]